MSRNRNKYCGVHLIPCLSKNIDVCGLGGELFVSFWEVFGVLGATFWCRDEQFDLDFSDFKTT